jgi:hypothetical protein
VEAALVGLGAMLFVGTRLGWASTQKLSKNFIEVGLNLWWAVPLLSALSLPVGLWIFLRRRRSASAVG